VVSEALRFASNVLFDLDGTLIDSAPAILATLRLVLAQHAVEPIVPLDRHLIGAPLLPMLAKLVGATREEDVAGLAATFRDVYDTEGLASTVAYDGLREVLAALVTGGRGLYVVTNKRDVPTRRILELFDVARYFASIHALDTTSPPARNKIELVRHVISAHGLNAAECVMVGDTAEDAVAAHANALCFVAATYGYGTPTVDAPSAPLATIASLRELPECLAGLAKRLPANITS
jgi:phosphoglycolate phosphatase